MKSIIKFVGAVAAGFIVTAGVAFAAPGGFNVPEPGSLALVGLAIAGLIAVSRKKWRFSVLRRDFASQCRLWFCIATVENSFLKAS
jgi:hypothetical protein